MNDIYISKITYTYTWHTRTHTHTRFSKVSNATTESTLYIVFLTYLNKKKLFFKKNGAATCFIRRFVKFRFTECDFISCSKGAIGAMPVFKKSVRFWQKSPTLGNKKGICVQNSRIFGQQKIPLFKQIKHKWLKKMLKAGMHLTSFSRTSVHRGPGYRWHDVPPTAPQIRKVFIDNTPNA